MICRVVLLNDTGRKLAHLEKQLRTGDSLAEELNRRRTVWTGEKTGKLTLAVLTKVAKASWTASRIWANNAPRRNFKPVL